MQGFKIKGWKGRSGEHWSPPTSAQCVGGAAQAGQGWEPNRVSSSPTRGGPNLVPAGSSSFNDKTTPKPWKLWCGSWLGFEAWELFLKETGTLGYIPVRLECRSEPGVCQSRSGAAQVHSEVPGSSPALVSYLRIRLSSMESQGPVGLLQYRQLFCKPHWWKGTIVHPAPRHIQRIFPLKPDFFFFSMRRYQDPRDQQCLSSLRGLFWIRLWMWFSKQLPNRNWTRTPAPDEENALPLTTLVFAKGICPQTTRTWGKMGQKRISVYKIEASPHQHLTTYPVCFVQCD